jgi:DNA helicase HerA-like ATPase
LLKQIETVIKLIRSKGIGIYFSTQNPMDIPASVLAQLGLKIQHSLRAFTAMDRKAIKQTAENYPETTFYKTEDLITQLGIGEALVTLLNEKGIPTPLAATMMLAPRSRMDILTEGEIDNIVSRSKLTAKYNKVIDSESAYEMLNEKLEEAAENAAEVVKPQKTVKAEKTTLEKVANSSITKSILRTAGNTIVRSILGSLGLGGTTRRRKTTSWF